MAIRSEELYERDAAVLAFPTSLARRRAAHQRKLVFLRRRVAVASVVTLSLFGLLQVAAAGPQVGSRPGAPAQVRMRPGSTLWDVADRFAAPGSDLRAYVEVLWDLNDLDSPPRAGARLSLPQ